MKKRKLKQRITAVIALILITFMVLAMFVACGKNDELSGETSIIPEQEEITNTEIDPDYNLEIETEESTTDQSDMLGRLNIYIMPEVVFETADSDGYFGIINTDLNIYNEQIDIYIAETNELIYSSDVLEVGESIENDCLDVILEPGEYECIAYFTAIDPESSASIGMAGVYITISIEN